MGHSISPQARYHETLLYLNSPNIQMGHTLPLKISLIYSKMEMKGPKLWGLPCSLGLEEVDS